jgi:hypothetical protein
MGKERVNRCEVICNIKKKTLGWGFSHTSTFGTYLIIGCLFLIIRF